MTFQTDLVRSVETASRGMATVKFTAKGQPSFFYRLRRFSLDSLGSGFGTGVHPAFIVDGVEKDEVLIGQYLASEVDGEAVSQPGRMPRVIIDHDDAVTLAGSTGTGHCICTNAMYAALALQARSLGQYPRGNNNDGRAHNDFTEFAVNVDGNPTEGGGFAEATAAGSGPQTWATPRSPWGVHDLNGNVWEWSPGMRIVDGEIQIIPNNDAALSATDLSAAGPWQAILASDGTLVDPGTVGAVKYATSGTADGTLVCGSGAALSSMVAHGTSETAIHRLKALGLMQPGAPIESDGFYINLSNERLPIRGGHWNNGSGAGVFALFLTAARSRALPLIGFRPAFVI